MNFREFNNSHHTSMYNCDFPVFRRGIPFIINLNEEHSIKFLESATISLKLDGRVITRFDLKIDEQVDGWKCEIDKDLSNIILHTPVSAAVGLYHISAYRGLKKVKLGDFLLLFNPWLEIDDVYMINEGLLSEYILATTTNIYVGSYYSISPKRWKLDQFESDSIMAAIFLMSQIESEDRSNPVKVARALSALINSNDDNGVIWGKWGSNYEGGTNPTSWIGSGNILTEYIRYKKSVKYGQCWVFSGVLCTVLRTIGIPARCITNFGSFHDSDGTLNWEIYLDENLNSIDKGDDSCWNFHCWNEAWMRRPDLSKKHDGWQVLDATPQERSKGLYRLGPASKYAIKSGRTAFEYDVGFVFAEVAANKIYYKRQEDGSFKQYLVKKNEVGKAISTKMVNSDRREDITAEYKRSDDSAIFRTNNPKLEEARTIEAARNRNIFISFSVPTSICMTDTFKGLASVTGMYDDRETTIKTEISLVTYTGKIISKLFDDTINCKEKEKSLVLYVDEKLLSSAVQIEFPYIRCKVSVFDENFDEYITDEKVIPIKTPDIEIIGLKKIYGISSRIKFSVSIKNLLEKPLTDLRLNVEFGDHDVPQITIGYLKPGKVVTKNITLTPITIGTKKVSISQVSNECSGFASIASFDVIG